MGKRGGPLNAAPPPPDELHERDIARYVANFRAFLGQARIEAARQALVAANADANPFRTLVLREKQPWLSAFEEVDRLTMQGARPLVLRGQRALSQRGPDDPLVLAAMAGKTLERVLPTLPEALRDSMRAKLLQLHGMAHPVLMEWDAAHFYLRRNFQIRWNDANVAGPEFRCEGHGLEFEVECKRITRGAKELLGDGPALTLGDGVVRAVVNLRLCGDVVLDTQARVSPAVDVVAGRVMEALRGAANLGELDLSLEGIGRLRGSLVPVLARSAGATMADIQRRVGAKPHDCRAFAAAVPNDAGRHPEAVVIYLRGPRATPEEHAAHITATANDAADQMSGDVAGIVMIELQGVEEAAAYYADNVFFQSINHAVFQRVPAVAAMIWRGERMAERGRDGFGLTREIFAQRNAACAFEAAGIPLVE